MSRCSIHSYQKDFFYQKVHNWWLQRPMLIEKRILFNAILHRNWIQEEQIHCEDENFKKNHLPFWSSWPTYQPNPLFHQHLCYLGKCCLPIRQMARQVTPLTQHYQTLLCCTQWCLLNLADDQAYWKILGSEKWLKLTSQSKPTYTGCLSPYQALNITSATHTLVH